MESSWPRIVLHADMDAFYAAVEQLDRPELRGKPVIIGFPGRRGVVTTASYEARPFGVKSAIPMARAMRLCPHALVIPPRFSRYVEVSGIIQAVFDSFSPLVEPLSLDEAFLDMTGAQGLFGPPRRMAERLREEVRRATGGLTVSVGVSTSKFVAKVASDQDKPDGLTLVEPGTERAFLAPLPIRRLWGVGPKTESRFVPLGLRTIGDLADADPRWLSRQLGGSGEDLARLARGEDPREVIPDRDARSVGAENTLEEDVVGAAQIRPHLLHSADRVAARLRKSGLFASGLRVKLKTSRFQIHSRQIVLPAPTDHAETLYEAALELLPSFDLEEPMRLVGLAGIGLVSASRPVQGELFDGATAARTRRLDRALDEVRAKFGDDALVRASELDEAPRRPPEPELPRRRGK